MRTRRPIRTPRSVWRRSIAMAAAVLAACAGVVWLPQVQPAEAVVSNLTLIRTSDGVSSIAAGDAVDDPDAMNGVVAANGIVKYEVGFNATPGESVTITGQLPAGVAWDEAYFLHCSTKTFSGGVSNGYRTNFSCTIPHAAAQNSFIIAAKPFKLANGSSFAPTVAVAGTALSAGGSGSQAAVSVAASATYVVRPTANISTTSVQLPTAPGAPGYRFAARVAFGNASSTNLGVEASAGPWSYDVRIPLFATFESVAHTTSAFPGSYSQGFTWGDVTAPGDPYRTIRITVPSPAEGFGRFGTITTGGPAFAAIGHATLTWSVRSDQLPLPTANPIAMQIGQVQATSVGGTSITQHAVPTSLCTTQTLNYAGGELCLLTSVNQVTGSPTDFRFMQPSWVNPNDPSVGLLRGSVVPGESAQLQAGVMNNGPTVTQPTGNVNFCATWDREFLTLNGPIIPALATATQVGLRPAPSSAVPMAAGDYALEYGVIPVTAATSDLNGRNTELRSASCGSAGDGATSPAGTVWASNLASLGQEANAVRVRMLTSLAPMEGLYVMPVLQRTLTPASMALSANTGLQVYFRASDSTKALASTWPTNQTVGGTGNYSGSRMNTVAAQFGAKPTWVTTAANGSSTTYQLNPWVVGPIAADTSHSVTVPHAQLRVELPNTCARITSIAPGGYLSATLLQPATPGDDGVFCTGDTTGANPETPEVWLFDLGDLAADSGAANVTRMFANLSTVDAIGIGTGHVVGLPQIEITVRHDIRSTPSSTQAITMRAFSDIDATNSATLLGRVATRQLTINSLQQLFAVKTATAWRGGVALTPGLGGIPTVLAGDRLDFTHEFFDAYSGRSFSKAQIFDVLPQNGDVNGSDAFASTASLAVTGYSVQMEPGTPGTMLGWYTSDDPAVVRAAIAAGTAETSVSWVSFAPTDTIAGSVTAVRFDSTHPMSAGNGGTVTLHTTVPAVFDTAHLFNQSHVSLIDSTDPQLSVHTDTNRAEVRSSNPALPKAFDDAFGDIRSDQAVTLGDILANDVGVGAITLTSVDAPPADVSVTWVGGVPTVSTTHAWGASETTYPVAFPYSIQDSTLVTSSATVSFTFVRPPVVTEPAAVRVREDATYADFAELTVLDPGRVAATSSTDPAVTVNTDGSLSVATSGVPLDTPTTFPVTVTDVLGQSAQTTLTVIRQKAPVGTGEHVTLLPGETSVVFDPIGNTVGTNLAPLGTGSVTAAPNTGTTTFAGVLLQYVPTGVAGSTDTFTVDVCDDLGQCASLVYSVTLPQGYTPTNPGGSGNPPTTDPGTNPGPTSALETTGGASLRALWVLGIVLAAAGGVLLLRRRRSAPPSDFRLR